MNNYTRRRKHILYIYNCVENIFFPSLISLENKKNIKKIYILTLQLLLIKQIRNNPLESSHSSSRENEFKDTFIPRFWHLRFARLSFERTERRDVHSPAVHKYNYLSVKLNLRLCEPLHLFRNLI